MMKINIHRRHIIPTDKRARRRFLTVIKFLFITLLFVAILFATLLRDVFFVEVRQQGGVLREGVIGAPSFINPVLSISSADRDLASLIYSGLTQKTKEGDLIPSLAERWEISPNAREYTFYLKDTATFHDGESVTAADILFTIQMIQNRGYRSPLLPDWNGVEVSVLSDHIVRFTLPRPYTPFIYNTTVGILPSHLWSDVTPETAILNALNIRPIGSGAYRVQDISFDQNGRPDEYVLRSFKKFALGESALSTIIVSFYLSEEERIAAALRGEINAFYEGERIVDDETLQRLTTLDIKKSKTLHVFGVFFNDELNDVLSKLSVRRAIGAAIDRAALIERALNGRAFPVDGPLSNPPLEKEKESALTLLEEDGWKRGDGGIYEKDEVSVSFTLTAVDTPLGRAIAEELVRQWRLSGIKVTLSLKKEDEFVSNTIRGRDFEAVLTGYTLSHGLDVYPFFHSSQINDPGLNLSGYVDIEVDGILEDARTIDKDSRKMVYTSIVKEIRNEVPIVFLYSPQFTYFVPKGLKGVETGAVARWEDRFITVHEWHFRTQYIWNVFSKNKQRVNTTTF